MKKMKRLEGVLENRTAKKEFYREKKMIANSHLS